MNMFFVLLFLFSFGCIFGWGLELLFRRIISKDKKWVNPGFLVGPYLPLYGFGLSVLYLISKNAVIIPISNVLLKNIVLFLSMGLAMTLIEYIAGDIFIRRMKIKLWDYSELWGNIGGIICPLYSFFWTVLSIIYYYALHPYVLELINWAFESVITYFLLGLFCGCFVIDFVYSAQILAKIRQFAKEKQIVVKLEEYKSNVIKNAEKTRKKAKFFLILSSGSSVETNLKRYHEHLEKLKEELKNKISKTK